MENLETTTSKKNFTIFGVDGKQWVPFYGVRQGLKDGFRDGKPSISTTDNDYLYWGAKVYHALWITGAIYGLSKL